MGKYKLGKLDLSTNVYHCGCCNLDGFASVIVPGVCTSCANVYRGEYSETRKTKKDIQDYLDWLKGFENEPRS